MAERPLDDSRLSRRAFVGLGLAAAATVGLAGWFGRGSLGAAEGRADLDGFLHVSRLLTGVDKLPDALAPVYLRALEALPLPASRFVQLAGRPRDLDELERSRALRTPAGRKTAEEIAAAWWSGTVPARGGRRVITFVDALVWRGMPFARPQTECLGEGGWSKPGRLAA